MIRDLSETLQAVLTQPGLPPELAAAQIVFDRPTDPFNPGQTTINVFLYDIRENVELRNNEPEITRLNGQIEVRRPPLRVACSYLVTAWPVGGQDLALQEHRLLSQVLQLLSGMPTIPPPFLQGSLVAQEPPLPMVTAQTDVLKNPAEFWTAIGNRLKATLSVTVTIALEVFPTEEFPMVITSETSLELLGRPGTRQDLFRIGGRVTDAASAPVAGAAVRLVERGRTTTTNTRGEFTLSAIPAGNYTLRATSGADVQEVPITVPAAVGSSYDLQFV